jgi:hypothetical protein
MDSGANIFIFPPVFAISGTIAPSSHCLTSATSGPAHVPLHSAEVMFDTRDSAGEMRRFLQRAFIHADLPFALFPLSALGAQGFYFDFYDVIGLQCGLMFLPFSLTKGLYLAEIFTICLDSSDFSIFIPPKLSLLLRRVPKIFFCLTWLCFPTFPFPSIFPHRLNLTSVCLLLPILFLLYQRLIILTGDFELFFGIRKKSLTNIKNLPLRHFTQLATWS